MGQAQLASRFDFATYMAWEAEQTERHEWVDGEVFAMTGARDAHNRIAGNLYVAFHQALRGSPCRVFMSDMKLRVESADAVFYPDVFVTCDARDRGPAADLAKQHPRLIVEVLSDSTAAYDRGRKFELYRQLPDLQEVLFVEQGRLQIDLFRRNAQGRWELYPASEGETLQLASVGLALSVAEVYAQVLPVVAADAESGAGPAQSS
ncbi:MAG TPA: Uma2 family endonuclease [Burkholderiaceae bacterium]|nr:Uma2 family endonuclease [Burkholderiaceae bacterium]HMY99710.1 Uma2 family endonuclease [Burkholderiaceae bacterium]HNB45084.1 Uma2 family endonuclease [Burkholderiaceae bacterium]HNG79193.1 Uma2 family endonuclease [Burkholderiaceae bacterium]